MQYHSIFRPGLFAGQTIIVTGGGCGLGRCTAHELRSLGARIALIGRTPEKLEQVKQELDDSDTFTFAADLRRDDRVKEAVERVLAWSGRIDGLVNNAGGQFPAQLKDISLNGWNAVIANNMTATFLVSKEVYRCWMEGNGGAIVNVGADWELGMPGMGHNGAARAGQTNFTYTASVEWADPDEASRHRVRDRRRHRLPAERGGRLCHRHRAQGRRWAAQQRQVQLLRG